MSAQPPSRHAPPRDAGSEYYYRRRLTLRELMPALGAAIGAGIATFYVMRVMAERTPLIARATVPAGRGVRVRAGRSLARDIDAL